MPQACALRCHLRFRKEAADAIQHSAHVKRSRCRASWRAVQHVVQVLRPLLRQLIELALGDRLVGVILRKLISMPKSIIACALLP